MEIRKAEIKDIEQVKLIIDRNFDEILSKHSSKAIIEKFKAHNSLESLSYQLTWKTVFIAEQDNKVIGTGAFVNYGNFDESKYCVSNLFIMPEFHARGIGTLLFKRLLQEAKDKSVDTLHVPSNKNAISFYKKMGFAEDKEQLETADGITWMTMKL